MKKIFVILFLLFIFGSFVYAQDEGVQRGFYIDVGLGWSWISYPEPLDSSVKAVSKLPSVSRVSLDFDLSIGYALMQNLYMVGSMGMVGDSLSSANTMTLTTILIGPGLKFYPLASQKYLQLGFDAGYSAMSVSVSDSKDTYNGPNGFGMQFTVVGDFDSTLTGPALLMGGKLYLGFLDSEMVAAFSLFAKFVYKGKKG